MPIGVGDVIIMVVVSGVIVAGNARTSSCIRLQACSWPDAQSRRRTPLEIQLRGWWKTAASLRRYAKATRLMTQAAKIPKAVLDFLQAKGRRVIVPRPRAEEQAQVPGLDSSCLSQRGK